MQRLFLLSIIIASFAIPIMAARGRSARRGLQKAVLLQILFNVFYLFGLIYLYPRL